MYLFSSVCRLEQIPAVLFLFSSWCNVMSEVRSGACGYLGEARAERALESCPQAGSLNPSPPGPKLGQVASPSSKLRRRAQGPNRAAGSSGQSWPLAFWCSFGQRWGRGHTGGCGHTGAQHGSLWVTPTDEAGGVGPRSVTRTARRDSQESGGTTKPLSPEHPLC